MLQPDNRLTLIDALRPPPGHEVDRVIGTTFSLDLQAALTAPAAFAFVQTTATGERDMEPIELLHSIRRHAARIVLFCQGGQIALPGQNRLLPFLEGTIIPVGAPKGGVFHPKIWVLRFATPEGDSVRYRLLCASRNLTFDRSWDTVLRLDQANTSDNGAVLDGLGAFVRALPGLAARPMDDDQRKQVHELGRELEAVRFEPPPGVETMVFHAMGLSNEPSWPFPADADRLLVVSPFLDAAFLGRLPQSRDRSAIVSRAETMDRVGESALENFGERLVLSPEAEPSEEADSTTDRAMPPDDPHWPLTGLHAKLYVMENDDCARVYTGSANATTAAFERNVEAVVELGGPRRSLGVDAFMDAPEGEVPLRSLLVPYIPASDQNQDEPAISAMDLLRREIGTLPFSGMVTQASGDDSYHVHYQTRGALNVPPKYELRCWPVTLPPEAMRVFDRTADSLCADFTVNFDHLTAFLAIEVDDGTKATRFVVPASLEGLPEDREGRLLRHLIGTTSRLLAYFLMLLSDDSMDRYELMQFLRRLNNSDTRDRTVAGLPMLETMLAAIRKDSARLGHVRSLVDDLRASEAGRALLPEGFETVWDAIWLVAQERTG